MREPRRRRTLGWIGISLGAHLGLALLAFSVHLAVRAVAGPASIYVLETTGSPAITIVHDAVVVVDLRLPVPQAGDPAGRAAAGPIASLASSTTAGTGHGSGEPAPARSTLAGADLHDWRAKLYSHPTQDNRRHGAASPRPAGTPRLLVHHAGSLSASSSGSPPPRLLSSATGTPTAPLLAAASGEGLSRIPKDGELPSLHSGVPPALGAARQPHPPGPPGSHGACQPQGAVDASTQRRLDPTELARPGGRGAGGGAGQGSAARRGSPLGKDHGAALWLSSPDPRFTDYFRRIYRKVNPLWVFPKKLEVLLEQGDVLVQFTILEGGQVEDVQVRKSSGFRQFDQNVVAAIRQASPFGRIPTGLGRRLQVLAPFEFANPMVR